MADDEIAVAAACPQCYQRCRRVRYKNTGQYRAAFPSESNRAKRGYPWILLRRIYWFHVTDKP